MPRESVAAKRARAAAVLGGLRTLYPDAKTELDFGTPFQLVIATLLSAQATDVSVNAATPALFARYPTCEAMALAAPEDVEPYIKTIGLYRNKAKNAVAAARRLVEVYGGKVPRTVEELVTLPGVGRKTANVVVSNAYHTSIKELYPTFTASTVSRTSTMAADIAKRVPRIGHPQVAVFQVADAKRFVAAGITQCGQAEGSL